MLSAVLRTTLVASAIFFTVFSCEKIFDVFPPEVKITQPADGANIKAGESITIEVEVSDNNNVDEVEITVDDDVIGLVSKSPYFVEWTATSDSGEHTIIAKAYDVGGNWTTDKITITTIITPGSIALFSIPYGASIYLDEVGTGNTTPYTLNEISYGMHKLHLYLFNYQLWQRNIFVESDTTIVVNAQLFPGEILTISMDASRDTWEGTPFIAFTFEFSDFNYFSSIYIESPEQQDGTYSYWSYSVGEQLDSGYTYTFGASMSDGSSPPGGYYSIRLSGKIPDNLGTSYTISDSLYVY